VDDSKVIFSDQLVGQGLSLERLQTFLRVARTSSIKTAAEGEATKQSLFSRQIGELEKALGCRLFRRDGRRMSLTSEGRHLSLLVASFFQGIDDLVAESRGSDRLIRVTGSESAFDELVWPLLSPLKRTFPSVTFEFVSEATGASLNALEKGEASIGIVRSSAVSEHHYSKPLGVVEFWLAASRSACGQSGKPGFTLLRRHPIPLLVGRGDFNAAITGLLREADCPLRPCARGSTFGALAEMLVQRACECAVLPKRLAGKLPTEKFAVANIEELKPLDRQFSLVCDRKAGGIRPALRELLDSWAERFGKANQQISAS
jgi:DNA-binding transcriptional LysR family regulator